MSRAFLDTNIFIDLLIDESNSNEYDKIRGSAENISLTRKIVRDYANSGYTFVLNTSTITNSTYFLQERQKISAQIVMDKISFIENDKDLFFIVLEEEKIRKQARDFAKENSADYEDALQYFCAKKSGCELIITNDKNFPKLDISLIRTAKNLDDFVALGK